ncbi:hypothetical protein J0X19_06510 [Hymenobacter sp. BT186]|uniref:Uncharacterized protein n=1 Tax=Hymenobacter telluris TaxID=2816474 RepID=A0A939EW25_9BACT|nr:hypothetical protein [Hymenobacter telluris]MBO0357592.1 hypothetical protein [Hymenobacter telluris]MBW3373618.1 hypothetical protein [Hymenobacter norwichensis]
MKIVLVILLSFIINKALCQNILVSWSQQNIEGLTKEKYDEAQRLPAEQLAEKNLKDASWCDVFLTLNASVNNHKQNKIYLEKIVDQITNDQETKLAGTSRLIIWDRVISNDILFEGKGLVIHNDLFKVSGRANEILQNLTGKNFGYVTSYSSNKDVIDLRKNWMDYLSNKEVKEVYSATQPNAKIPEISSLSAFHAIVISLNDNPKKSEITKRCLNNIYQLEKMPNDEASPAQYCNPDRYSFAYLSMLIGDEKFDKNKDAKWWNAFWNKNKSNLSWNSSRGCYELK